MRSCSIPGCEAPELTKTLCSSHYYRWRNYGDPLAETKRRSRSAKPTNLKVDPSKLGEPAWQEAPTHCPQGHPLSGDNLSVRTLRDGSKRNICRVCAAAATKRWASGEKPDRSYVCVDCGATNEAASFGRKPTRCPDCSIERHRAKSRIRMAEERGQELKTETYSCKACGTISPTPAVPGLAPRYCNACADERAKKVRQGTWRATNLKKYNLTAERYEQLVERQKGVCAVCGTNDPGGAVARWHVDHDHACCPSGNSCGKCIRGLLCSRCNTGIGLLGDTPESLAKALEYLRNPPAQTP
jgi:DNA-directed RNA polymerase subunit RPC12/RpoP